jgi:L-rhamnose-H+ transport protein
VELWLGVTFVVLGGMVAGSHPWPIKVMRKYQFEHWFFVFMVVGYIVLPWAITLALCPHALSAYRSVDYAVLIRANLFALCWAVAALLMALSFVRIGVGLTGGIVTGLGACVGVITPMVFKGSGLFHESPNVNSLAGKTVLAGVAVMLAGVVLVASAGFGRDRVLRKSERQVSGFAGGLIMSVLAGILSCGVSFAFVYAQGPIVLAMKAHGARDIPAVYAVWAAGLFLGAVANALYAAHLMTRNKSWGVLFGSWRELLLSSIIGVHACLCIFFMGRGMLLLGTLGASVGFGIVQAMQMVGNQGVGFLSGEWRKVHGAPRNRMYLAIVVLILAAGIMACGSSLSTPP